MAKKKITVLDGKKIARKGAARVKETDFKKVLEKSRAIESKFVHARPLNRFFEDFKLLMAVVSDYRKGVYRKIPRWSIAVIVFALLYVLNPFDIIADFIAFIGYLDDAAVVAGALLLVEKDLNEYKEWKLSHSAR
ncbi:MAG TPA: DUF1232 domain-containing protein [Acidobacteriota bacterium]